MHVVVVSRHDLKSGAIVLSVGAVGVLSVGAVGVLSVGAVGADGGQGCVV